MRRIANRDGSSRWLQRQMGLVALVLAALALAAAGCGGSDSSSSTGSTEGGGSTSASGAEIPDGPITIGLAMAETGAMSFYDQPIRQGIDKALSSVNAKGGVLGHELRLIDTDAKSDPAQAGPAVAKLISEGAQLIVPMNDYDLGSPGQREAQTKGVLSLTAAGSPLTNLIGEPAYGVTSTTPEGGTSAAEFALQEGWDKGYVLLDTFVDFSKSWCSSFSEAFERGGGTIVGEDTYQTEDQSLASQVTGLKDSGDANVVVLCGFPPTGVTAIKQIRAAGVNLPIVTTQSFSTPAWVAGVPDASDVYSVGAPVSVYGDDPNPAVNQFFKGSDRESDASAYGYALVQVFQAAIERAESVEGAALGEAMREFKEVPTLLGPTTYSDSCRVPTGRGSIIIQFQKGEGSYLETFQPTDVVYPKGVTCP